MRIANFYYLFINVLFQRLFTNKLLKDGVKCGEKYNIKFIIFAEVIKNFHKFVFYCTYSKIDSFLKEIFYKNKLV